jgi:hypothetical protein
MEEKIVSYPFDKNLFLQSKTYDIKKVIMCSYSRELVPNIDKI